MTHEEMKKKLGLGQKVDPEQDRLSLFGPEDDLPKKKKQRDPNVMTGEEYYKTHPPLETPTFYSRKNS